MGEPANGAVRSGRPRVASRAELERIGFALFERQGFDDTTIDDIASAAGIGRRTFFRYFASKNDLVWGEFEEQLSRLKALLDEVPAHVPMMDAIRHAVIEFNRFDSAIVPWHRRRMELILRVPALRADSTLRYISWQKLITEFIAGRTGQPADGPVPRLAGNLALTTSVTAYELWLEDESADLTALLDTLFTRLAGAFRDVPEVRS